LLVGERDNRRVSNGDQVSRTALALKRSKSVDFTGYWQLAPLQRVRGKVEFDGLERVSSQTLLDMLEVPQRSRTAGTYRRLAKLMAELDWTAVRVRDLTRGGYKEQVRGYVRDVPSAMDHIGQATRRREKLLPSSDVT
jgi:hypothetical protein